MAFPTVRSSVGTNGTTATASPVVTLPTTIAAGDVLFVVCRVAAAGAIGWPAGWTELFDASPDAANDQMAAAWRMANGSEGSTITLSCTNAKFSAIAYSIAGSIDPNVQAPQLSTVAVGTSANPNATTCTPTGGAKDYLWLTFTGREGEATVTITYPTNYTVAQLHANSGTAGAVDTNVRVTGAVRTNLNAASEDAGAWTFSDVEDWTAYTIAFHPGIAVNSPGRSDGVATPAERRLRRHFSTVASIGLMGLLVTAPVGATAIAKPAQRGRIVVSSETLPPPPAAAEALPPGQQSRGIPAQRERVRPWAVAAPLPTPAVIDTLPPGQQVRRDPPQRTHPRPWSVWTEQPRPLPPGAQGRGAPVQRRHPRPWSVSVEQPRPIPPGQQVRNIPARHARVRPWSQSPTPPITTEAVRLPGQTSLATPAQHRGVRGWTTPGYLPALSPTPVSSDPTTAILAILQVTPGGVAGLGRTETSPSTTRLGD